ncbi:MAG: mechanosensitive ion channel family protein [Nanoarchaeota archaeon]|nr:mechanosensitive ion channel family protein [Nanoarchaeota archaeon]
MESPPKLWHWIKNRKSFIFGAIVVLALLVSAFWYSCTGFICDVVRENKLLIFSTIGKYLPRIVTVLLIFLFFKVGATLFFELVLPKFLKLLQSEDHILGIKRIGRFVWWSVFTLLSLSITIGHLGALMANLGLIGLGLTFALQKPILNFVGWLTLTAKGTYAEGDRIRVGQNIRGDVREIQIMNTVIDGLLDASDVKSDKVITFPNEFILTMDVENFTKDSNYIMDEMKIGITYESNYRKAAKLLENIISAYIKRNKKFYIRQIIHQQEQVDRGLGRLLSQKYISSKEQKELHGFRVEEEALKRDMQELETLEEEFRPKVRMELGDSSIQLIPQFFTPYDQKKKTRTEIILNFLDAIKAERDIQIAYPHMQLVTVKAQEPPAQQTPAHGLQTTLQRAFIEQ